MHVSVVKRAHPIAGTYFHLGSWLLNSWKWASQFLWYEAILIKPVDQPWLNSTVWRFNLINLIEKFIFTMTISWVWFIVVPHLPHSNLDLPNYSFSSILFTMVLRSCIWLSKWIISTNPNKKVTQRTCNSAILQFLRHFREIFKRFYNFFSRWTQDGCHSIAYQLEMSH